MKFVSPKCHDALSIALTKQLSSHPILGTISHGGPFINIHVVGLRVIRSVFFKVAGR